jgi:hypothetical protein
MVACQAKTTRSGIKTKDNPNLLGFIQTTRRVREVDPLAGFLTQKVPSLTIFTN